MITKYELIEGTVAELTDYINTTYLEPINKVKPNAYDPAEFGNKLQSIASNKPPLGALFHPSLKEVTTDGEIRIEYILTYVKVK
jgi:hypothetical protein